MQIDTICECSSVDLRGGIEEFRIVRASNEKFKSSSDGKSESKPPVTDTRFKFQEKSFDKFGGIQSNESKSFPILQAFVSKCK